MEERFGEMKRLGVANLPWMEFVSRFKTRYRRNVPYEEIGMGDLNQNIRLESVREKWC